jgi:phosphoglycerate dehydrogenase-like enzyme
MTTPCPKALYLLDSGAIEKIYGEEERAAVAGLADVYAPLQTGDSVAKNPGVLAEAEVILSGWGAPAMDGGFLAAATNLRVVFYGAGSLRRVATPAFWERGLRITSAYAVPVSEYALAAILFSLKLGWHFAFSAQREKALPRQGQVPGAYGSTVGLVSLGMVGRLVRERLRPFDLRVVAYDPFVTPEEAHVLGVDLMSLEDLFASSDVVSLHVPLLPETEGMILGSHLASMKRNATLINTSRGAVVREAEMVEVLGERPAGGGVWEPRWAPLEDGVVDFGLVFEALEHVGYTGWLVMEDFSGVRPSREALRYNLEFVRSFIGSS